MEAPGVEGLARNWGSWHFVLSEGKSLEGARGMTQPWLLCGAWTAGGRREAARPAEGG